MGLDDSRLTQIDKITAILIAVRFFGQHHSEISVKDVTSNGKAWIVKVAIGLLDRKIMQVEIHDNTGEIIGWT